MTVEQVKASILQLAIQGKLVPQDPNDEPASELLKRIEAAKNAKGAKKGKPLPPITDDEKPFSIPDSWEWVRLGEIFTIESAKRVHQSEWKTSGVPFYRAREIARLADTGVVQNELYVSEAHFEKLKAYGYPQPNDLMITAVGTIGKAYVVKKSDRFYYKDASVICFRNINQMFAPFFKLLMASPLMDKTVHSKSAGTTVDTITIEKASSYLIPLPPLAEQKRIVAKVEALFKYVDECEDSRKQLAEKLAETLKRSVLQEAIQGRLVPQDPNDEPACELLKRIAAEREKQIADKKIKKPKPLPPITDDEKPFPIPDSWEWVRLGELVHYSMGKTPPRSDVKYWIDGAYNWVSISDMVADGHIVATNERVSAIAAKAIFGERISEPGTLLMSFKLTVGKVSILDIPAFHNEAMISIYPFADNGNTTRDYLFKVLPVLSQNGETKSAIKGNTLNSSSLNNLLIPLPPIAEQKRIVAKVDSLLAKIVEVREAVC